MVKPFIAVLMTTVVQVVEARHNGGCLLMGEHGCAVASLWLEHAPSISLAIGPRQRVCLCWLVEPFRGRGVLGVRLVGPLNVFTPAGALVNFFWDDNACYFYSFQEFQHIFLNIFNIEYFQETIS